MFNRSTDIGNPYFVTDFKENASRILLLRYISVDLY